MLRCSKFLTLLLLLSPAIGFARGVPNGESPAFTQVPELSAGFDLLYEQKFAEGRQIFANWESRNPEDPFGEVAVVASYLFEELYLQGALTSNFFLKEKNFLHGIDVAIYIIGSQGAGSPFALWFDGIHGDKKLGMEQVAKTAENGRDLRPFAKVILALAARREKQAPPRAKVVTGIVGPVSG